VASAHGCADFTAPLTLLQARVTIDRTKSYSRSVWGDQLRLPTGIVLSISLNQNTPYEYQNGDRLGTTSPLVVQGAPVLAVDDIMSYPFDRQGPPQLL
jgi:hypothetical protein